MNQNTQSADAEIQRETALGRMTSIPWNSLESTKTGKEKNFLVFVRVVWAEENSVANRISAVNGAPKPQETSPGEEDYFRNETE